jgi:hypothetical protein
MEGELSDKVHLEMSQWNPFVQWMYTNLKKDKSYKIMCLSWPKLKGSYIFLKLASE